jgi:hypothetical protein
LLISKLEELSLPEASTAATLKYHVPLARPVTVARDAALSEINRLWEYFS